MFSWKKKKKDWIVQWKRNSRPFDIWQEILKKANFPTHVSVCIEAFDFYRTPLFFVEKKNTMTSD